MHIVSGHNLKKKKLANFFNGLGHGLFGSGQGQPVFALDQKNRVRVRYFSGRVELGQKILTCIAMSNAVFAELDKLDMWLNFK